MFGKTKRLEEEIDDLRYSINQQQRQHEILECMHEALCKRVDLLKEQGDLLEKNMPSHPADDEWLQKHESLHGRVLAADQRRRDVMLNPSGPQPDEGEKMDSPPPLGEELMKRAEALEAMLRLSGKESCAKFVLRMAEEIIELRGGSRRESEESFDSRLRAVIGDLEDLWAEAPERSERERDLCDSLFDSLMTLREACDAGEGNS